MTEKRKDTVSNSSRSLAGIDCELTQRFMDKRPVPRGYATNGLPKLRDEELTEDDLKKSQQVGLDG